MSSKFRISLLSTLSRSYKPTSFNQRLFHTSSLRFSNKTDSLPWETLISNNASFSNSFSKSQPELLSLLSTAQHPQVLWIGCADSRCPETTLLDARPGDVFVHRNIANVIRTTDASANAVIDFAVWQLKVKHVVVCGHTACGGARASLGDDDLGPNLNGWLEPVRNLRKEIASKLEVESNKGDALAVENVKMSVNAVLENGKVKEALAEGRLQVHGAMYDVRTCKLEVLKL